MARIERYQSPPLAPYKYNLDWLRMKEVEYAYAENNRIRKTFSATEVAGQVFPNPDENARFVAGLCEITEKGASLKTGGRRIREMIGCKTYDLAPYVVGDTWFLSPHNQLRLGSEVLKILLDYPTQRMTNPDLDLFVWGMDMSWVKECLDAHGFETNLHQATGNITIAEINSGTGSTTFIDGKKSWQSQERYPWPPYGFQAPLERDEDGEAVFKVDIVNARMYYNPLELGGIDTYEPTDPIRYAAIGRTLLWATTATDPLGKPLRLPTHATQHAMLDTIKTLPQILDKCKNDPTQLAKYKGSIRDLTLSLLVLLKNQDTLATRDPFFGEAMSAFYGGKYNLPESTQNHK